MFIDVCFPNKNESEFIRIAGRLSTKSLLFVYDDTADIKKTQDGFILKYYGLHFSRKNNRKNPILLYDRFETDLIPGALYYFRGEEGKRKFNAPFPISQVKIKEFKEKGCMLGISFDYLLSSVYNPDIIEKVCFFIGLCNKYKVRVFFASFAKAPYRLRGRRELESILRFITDDPGKNKDVFENLSLFFQEHNIASFL